MKAGSSKPRLAAVLVTDTVDYTKRMEANERATIVAVKACMNKQVQAIKRNGGKFIKSTGDGSISTYASTVDALSSAMQMQRAAAALNRGKRKDRQIVLRAGLAVGDVYDDGEDILGRCVIMASRLEAIATPGTICLPALASHDLASKVLIKFSDLGFHKLKGFLHPVHLCQFDPRVRMTKSAAGRTAEAVFSLKRAFLTGGGDLEFHGDATDFRVEVANLGEIPGYLFAFDWRLARLQDVQSRLLPVKQRYALNERVMPDDGTKVIARVPLDRRGHDILYGAFWYRDVGGMPDRISRFILRIADDGHTRLDVTGVHPDYTSWT